MNNENIRPRPIGDRVTGLARAVFGAFLTYEIAKNNPGYMVVAPAIALGSALVLDGLADLVSGELHYLSQIKIIPINRR